MTDQKLTCRVLRMRQLASTPYSIGYLPVSATTIWRWIKEGTFPKGHKIGPKTTIWYESEVKNWLEDQSSGTKSNQHLTIKF